jgi:hypothetical protein
MKCVLMQRLGVKTINSTDAMGRSRFHCFDPETHLFGVYPKWYKMYPVLHLGRQLLIAVYAQIFEHTSS